MRRGQEKGSDRPGCSSSVSSQHKFHHSIHSFFFLWIDLPGLIAGMSGLLNLVSKIGPKSPQVFWLTIAFFTLIGVLPTIASVILLFIKWSVGKVAMTGVGLFLFLFVATSVFYCDLCLGFMFGDILDTPSDKNKATVLYWLYFAGERLPLFTW